MCKHFNAYLCILQNTKIPNANWYVSLSLLNSTWFNYQMFIHLSMIKRYAYFIYLSIFFLFASTSIYLSITQPCIFLAVISMQFWVWRRGGGMRGLHIGLKQVIRGAWYVHSYLGIPISVYPSTDPLFLLDVLLSRCSPVSRNSESVSRERAFNPDTYNRRA